MFHICVGAVHAMQSLDLVFAWVPLPPPLLPHFLQGGTVPQDLSDCVDAAAEGYQTHVLEDEQAELFCCWAESVLLKLWCVLHGAGGVHWRVKTGRCLGRAGGAVLLLGGECHAEAVVGAYRASGGAGQEGTEVSVAIPLPGRGRQVR